MFSILQNRLSNTRQVAHWHVPIVICRTKCLIDITSRSTLEIVCTSLAPSKAIKRQWSQLTVTARLSNNKTSCPRWPKAHTLPIVAMPSLQPTKHQCKPNNHSRLISLSRVHSLATTLRRTTHRNALTSSPRQSSRRKLSWKVTTSSVSLCTKRPTGLTRTYKMRRLLYKVVVSRIPETWQQARLWRVRAPCSIRTSLRASSIRHHKLPLMETV